MIGLVPEQLEKIQIGCQWSKPGQCCGPRIVDHIEALYGGKLLVNIGGEKVQQILRVTNAVEAVSAGVDDHPFW